MTGTLKYVTDVTAFPGETSGGHFFPVTLGSKYKDVEKTVKRDGVERTKSTDQDWVLYVPTPETKFTFSTDTDGDILTIDFSDAKFENPIVDVKYDEELGDGNGGKSVDELVEDNIKMNWSEDGKTLTPTGSVKYINNYGDTYGTDQQSGHFFPIKFNEVLYKSLHVGGTVADAEGGGNFSGGKDITPSEEDPYLITRIENCTDGNKLPIYDGTSKDLITTIDFNSATLPAVCVMGQDEDTGYGTKKVSDLMKPNVKITWDSTGKKGKVTGTFKYVSKWDGLPKGATDHGHFFAMRINKKYLGQKFTYIRGNEKRGSTVETAGEDEMFWILRIDTNKKHTFKSGEDVIAELDFRTATLGG